MNYQELFLEANDNWDLNRLNEAIALQRNRTNRHKKLTDLEATILRGLLCDRTAKEIATHFSKESRSRIQKTNCTSTDRDGNRSSY
jgi:hypothetical protein